MGEFVEPDEPAADVRAAYEAGWTATTARTGRIWRCEHMTMTGPGAGIVGWCGCEMTEVVFR